jgi:hypothetical protein
VTRMVLGRGRFEGPLRAELTAQDLLVLDEGLAGSITYRNYRDAHENSSWAREPVRGAIALTPNRLVVWVGRGKHIDIPLTGPFRTAVAVTVEPGNRVCFTYDAGRFHRDRSGTVTVRLRTPRAARIAELRNPSG